MATVSVFVPCYNYGHYLRACVESVLKQEGVEVRVLILDDCSPDNTPEVAAQLCREDARVEYRRHVRNVGHIRTYNEGLEWASGDYVLLLSADDMLAPGALARAAGVMDEHPEVVLTCGGEVRAAEPKFDAVSDRGSSTCKILTGAEFWQKSCADGRNIVSTPTAVARTSTHKRVGGYSEALPHSGDLEMWLRLAAYGSVGVIQAVQGFYRVHGQNMSVGFEGLRDLQQRKAAFDAAAATLGDRIPDSPRLVARAARALAEQAFWVGSRLFEEKRLLLSRQCLDGALNMCPELKDWRCWRRQQLKEFMGPGVWGVIRPLMVWARGRRPVA
jgi:GT2 family glycosyltransferase